MKIRIQMPNKNMTLLKQLARKLGITRSEFIRRAISSALTSNRIQINDDDYAAKMNHQAFGLLRNSPTDGLVVQSQLRSEW